MSNIKIILFTSAIFGALFAPSFSFASHGSASQDFYLSASPSGIREVGRTGQIQYIISLNSEGGFSESVSLKFNSSYSDLSGSFSKTSIVPGQISTLTLSASGAAAVGEYTSGIEVVGTSNGFPSLVRKLPIQVRVTAATSTSTTPSAITASLSATVNGILTSQVLRGAPVTVNWTSQNATECQAVSGAGFSTGGAVSGSINIPALTSGATFAIQCTGSGNSQNASITVNTFTHKLYVAAYEMENCSQNSASPMGSDASYIRTSFFGPGGYISSEGSAYTGIPITIATTGDYTLQDAIFTNFFVGQDYHFCDAEGIPANFNSLIFPQERTISLFYQNIYFGEDDDNTSNSDGGQTSNESYSVPAVNTQEASFISQSSVLLNGTVNPQGAVSSAWFEYGTSSSLGSTTFAQPAGMGTNSILYSFALTGLSADTTYYYRAVASNRNGTVYGSILSFRTLGIAAPVIFTPAPVPAPSPAPQPIVTVVQQVAENPLSCVDMSATLDKQELLSDQEFNYILHIQNNCSAALSNLSIVVTLPDEVSFVSTSYPFRKNSGIITYNLGTLEKDIEAAILVHAKIGSAKRGETITFFSRANFTYQGKSYSVSSPLSVVIGAKNFFSANVLDFAGNILDYLLIVLIVVGVMFAWNFFKNKKKG